MLATFFGSQKPMTNGIHNKTAKGLTLGWTQQYFSHIFREVRQMANLMSGTTQRSSFLYNVCAGHALQFMLLILYIFLKLLVTHICTHFLKQYF